MIPKRIHKVSHHRRATAGAPRPADARALATFSGLGSSCVVVTNSNNNNNNNNNNKGGMKRWVSVPHSIDARPGGEAILSLQSPPPTHRLNEGGRHSYYIVTTGRARLYKGNLLTMAAQWLERVRRHRWANLHVGQ